MNPMREDIGVTVATEQRFMAYGGGIFAAAAGGESFWQRYLEIFPWLRIVARIQPIDVLPITAVPVNDRRIKFAPLPAYIGPTAMVLKMPVLWSRTRSVAQDNAAYIIRVPGMIGSLLFRHLRARQWPYAVEVVGDPYDSLSPGAIGKAWTYLARPVAARGLGQQCWYAAATTYVTETTLQRRYPTQAKYATHYSDVELSDDLVKFSLSYRQSPTVEQDRVTRKIPRLIFVGSLAQRYKGLHILLQALKFCSEQGVTTELEVLGDGVYRSEYEELTSASGLNQVVTFHGMVPQGKDVIRQFCQSDMFIMPSLVEGLPRAMIEAMACGLPCIGSCVGGIPELLETEYMVPPGDAPALAAKILEVVRDPERMQQMGQRNRVVSMEYRSDVLRDRRQSFYQYIRDATLEHKNMMKNSR